MSVKRKQIRKIGILTGGGDCPGLNAVIRVVTKAAITQLGLEVIGIEDGFLGLIRNRMHPLGLDDVSNILTVGGTILGTSNDADPIRFAVGRDEHGKPLFENVTDRVVEHVADRGLDAIVAVGGDGTMTGAANLIERGIAVVGVPKTIDNDLMHTDITFGFSTAVQTAVECLDRIHTTASSHHRVMIVELMGRNAGWLTLHAGLAAGADVVLIPEIPYDVDVVCEKCLERSKRGKRFTLIAVSEGAMPKGGKQVVDRVVHESPDPIRLGGISAVLSREIAQKTHLETRATILGHVQRGGAPVATDRVLAMRFGHKAIQLVAMHEWNNIVVMQGGETTFVPITSVAGQQRLVPIDDPLIAMARSVETCMGD
ncbi:MAG: Pyrophosphate--fructose 6-phosphate 1-phosphotransferase [Phycisphaerae bacterium]|nr:Pyrophosphate--fructose 6-phosphate 1-phosphotransferase [Phycisphaerae bacterium]